MSFAIRSKQIATNEGPQKMLTTSHAIAEVAMLVAAAATVAGAEIIKESATPDELLILWCIVGGLLGAACSLRFFPVSGFWPNIWQLGVNLVLSAAFSPQLCYWPVSAWTGAPIGLRLALPVSVTVGACGQAIVALIIPWGKKYIETRAAKLVEGDKPTP